MLELEPKSIASAPRVSRDAQSKQPRRLLVALAILLVALVAILVRDSQFWFGSDDSISDADTVTPEVAHQTPATTSDSIPTKSVPAPALKKPAVIAKKSSEPNSPDSGSVTATRTVLPPLDVEVVAGDSHRAVHPGSNSTHVEITKPGSASSITTNAASRERISNAVVSHEANYPLLAKHMNVEGSVVLQALISAEGTIENLHVLSGPGILATAAQQAVREWKFKPVIQNGQAVETKATITVNFNIKIADNSSKDEIASAMPLRYSYTSTSDRASR